MSKRAIELLELHGQSTGSIINYLETNNFTGEIPKSPHELRKLVLSLALKETHNGSRKIINKGDV